MLQRLFISCGFGWGVRIAGFICLALCALACCLVTTNRSKTDNRVSAPWFDKKHFTDKTFVLLTLGSVFVSLGTIPTHIYKTSPSLTPLSRLIRTQLLHRHLLATIPHLTGHLLLRPRGAQRREHPRARRARLPLGRARAVQHPRAVRVPRGALDAPLLVLLENPRGDHAVRSRVRVLLGRVQRAHRPLHRAGVEDGRARGEDGVVV